VHWQLCKEVDNPVFAVFVVQLKDAIQRIYRGQINDRQGILSLEG